MAFVLFSDSSRIDLDKLRREISLPVRLLGIGLPLTIALGALVAAVLFGDLTFWEAAILGGIPAPTGAALGQAVVTESRVPGRVRQGSTWRAVSATGSASSTESAPAEVTRTRGFLAQGQ